MIKYKLEKNSQNHIFTPCRIHDNTFIKQNIVLQVKYCAMISDLVKLYLARKFSVLNLHPVYFYQDFTQISHMLQVNF